MQYIQARHFTDTGSAGRRIDLIVQHLMVAPETSDRAEACAAMFHSTDREASAHYCVDNDSEVQCVRDQDVAWAAPGANSDGLHIEQAGTLQSVRQWRDDYTQAMLDRNASLTGRLCVKYEIPARWLEAPDLLANKRGITDHWEVTKAFRLSTHTDCGEAYREIVPGFIDQVRREIRNHGEDPLVGKPDRKPELPAVRQGDIGWLVKRAQKFLVRSGFMTGAERDGHFGKETFAAVKAFQKSRGLEADGVVGERTWQALRAG